MATNHRPFFSIVVACYNPRKYISRLLMSIVNQHLPEEIEVILSDDHSTENYDDIVDKFKKYIHIKRTITDYNFAPGNTRQKGTEIATGQWMCFADQDDEFYPDSLVHVMEGIINSGERFYVVTDFNECSLDENRSVIREFRQCLGWCHGKFYNLDNMWKKFGMEFKKDFKSHEDIYICSRANCVMRFLNNKMPTYVPVLTYCWLQNPNSLTHVKYNIDESDGKERTFLEYLFDDYITSTGGVYIEQYELNNIDKEYAMSSVIEVFAYCYFYIMGFIFHEPDHYLQINIEHARNYLIKIKELFGVTNQDIYNHLAANDAQLFTQIKTSADIASGPYIPSMTLMGFLDHLHKDIKPAATCNDKISNN